MTGFPEAFRKFEDRLRFGLRFSMYNDDHNEESESKMIAFANGDAGAKELYNLYTQQSDTKITKALGLYKRFTVCCTVLRFFLHKNLTTFSNCVVDLPFDVPFMIEDNNLPFDCLIEDKILSYCKITQTNTLTQSQYIIKTKKMFWLFKLIN